MPQFDFSTKYKAEKPPSWSDKKSFLKQFFMPSGQTRRVLLLTNEDPLFVGYIHSLYGLSKARGLGLKATEFAICPINNDLPEYKGKHCPLCDVKGKDGKNLSFAKRIVMYPLLDMGIVENPEDPESKVLPNEFNDKLYQFQLSYAFMGFPTPKSAGALSILTKLTKKHKNQLRGLVLNVTRDADGDFSVGNDWEALEGEAGRIQLPLAEAEQATAIKAYIRKYSEVYGEIPDEDARLKYLTMKYATMADLPIYSPDALATRYGLTEEWTGGSKTVAAKPTIKSDPFSSALAEADSPEDEDIPF
jgi:hypothetical protein